MNPEFEKRSSQLHSSAGTGYTVLTALELLFLLYAEILSEVFEAGTVSIPHKMDGTDGAVALFADDDLSHALEFGAISGRQTVEFWPIDEHDHVGILFDGTALSKV